jgi:hypothetical protein
VNSVIFYAIKIKNFLEAKWISSLVGIISIGATGYGLVVDHSIVEASATGNTLIYCKGELQKLEEDKDDLEKEAKKAKKFVDEIDGLVQKAVKEKRHSELIPIVQTLISLVQKDREKLKILRDSLNSDIDNLALEVRQPAPNRKEVIRLLKIINNQWTRKKADLDEETADIERAIDSKEAKLREKCQTVQI